MNTSLLAARAARPGKMVLATPLRDYGLDGDASEDLVRGQAGSAWMATPGAHPWTLVLHKTCALA
ncbi:MAG: hypothetical protein ACRCTP_20150 [Aeromonas popoffii]|uniref:hypothetical protein n=1 Tax=Aeromonas popoffii TaxID=70856 RepID=UPI003F309DFF